MPLFVVRPTECMEGQTDHLLVHAANPEKARKEAVDYMINQGLYGDLEVFADPDQSTVERVVSRGRAGVIRRAIHHCEDHS